MRAYFRFTTCAVVFLLTGLWTAAFSSPTRYLLTDLGSVSEDSIGSSVGNSGIVAGKTNVDPNYGRAFLWQNGGRFFLNLPCDASIIWAINSSGLMGGSYSVLGNGQRDAFLYQNGTVTTLQPLPGQTISEVLGLNDSSLAVGYSGTVATSWQGGVATVLPGLGSVSAAWAVNQQGQIVGETSVPGMPWNVPFTSLNGFSSILPYPPELNQVENGVALSINSAGHAVGFAVFPHGVHNAITWVDGQATMLQEGAEALCINNNDVIVGRYPVKQHHPGPIHGDAVIWENGNRSRLDDRVFDLHGLHLVQARSVNDDGEIVGVAVDDDLTFHGFLLTPISELIGISAAPNPIKGGLISTGTITLEKPAPLGGTLVSLQSLNTLAATVPQSIIVPAGSTTATFPIKTLPAAQDVAVTVRGFVVDTWKSVLLTVLSPFPHLDTFFLSANTVFSAQPLTGTVTLRDPAPLGGIKVTLTNSTPSLAVVPTSITIPQGSISKSFNITTASVANVSSGTTIKAIYTSQTLQQILSVAPIVIQSLQLSVSSVTGGVTLSGVVRVPVPAPNAGYKITLLSSNTTAATVPTAVTIPRGASSAPFSIKTKPVPGTTFLSITARSGTSSMSAQLIVLPPEVATFTISPATVRGGLKATGKVTLTGKAPPGGVVVDIQRSSTLVTPASNVKVSAGGTSVSFQLTTSAVPLTTPVNLTVRTFSVQKSAVLTLTH